MSSEWSKVRIDQMGEVRSGKRLPLGMSLIETPTPFPYIRLVDVSDGQIQSRDLKYLTADARSSVRRYVVNTGDVCLAIVGHTIGMVFYVDAAWDDVNLTENAARITKFSQSVNSRYLYYYLTSPAGQSAIQARKVGSAQGKLPLYNIKSLEVMVPPRDGQDTIVGMLDALTDRITLLRETNATLEAIAQALFKSWFVDFDPVRAKMEGRVPDGMYEDTAALFPDGFEGSALGLVPRGWSAAAVYDLATYINGAAYKAFEPNLDRRGLPIIKIAELKAGVTSQTAYSEVAMPDKYRIETGDILFSWSGNPDTSIDTFVWTHAPGWLNQHIFRVIPLAQSQRSFLLQTLKQLRPVFAELARNKQTTGLGHVTIADMKRLQVITPDSTVLAEFEQTVGPIHARIFQNQIVAQNISDIRDTLLPRLISGQLRIPLAQETYA